MPTVVLAEGGDPIKDGNAWEIYKAKADGTRGDNITTEYNDYKASLEPGDYVVVARARRGQKPSSWSRSRPGQVYKPVFVLNAGTLIIHPRPSEGADVSDGAAVVIDYPGRRRSVDLLRQHQGGPCRPATRRSRSRSARARLPKRSRSPPARRSRRTSSSASAMSSPMPSMSPAATRSTLGGLTFQVVKAKKKIDGTPRGCADDLWRRTQVRPAARRLCG